MLCMNSKLSFACAASNIGNTKRLGQFRVLGLPSQWSLSIGLLRGLRSFCFLGSLRATGSGPISPSVRRPCTAGRDRASPSSSYSDPLELVLFGSVGGVGSVQVLLW
ncbi:hypothetical protein ACOSQ2_020580 [Xanthoceras sorbifolium]